MQGRAAVIGTGLVSGLGCGVHDTYTRMLAGDIGIRPITRFPVEPYAQPQAGQLAEADEAHLLDTWAEDDLTWGLIFAAAAEALGELPESPAPDPQLGLVLATNFGIMETLCWSWQERLDTGEMDRATFCRQQDVIATVAERLGVGGPRLQLSLSCASGAAAVTVARDWLRSGRASRVLAIGYDVLSEYIWCGLSNLRTITPERLRPFNSERLGTIFSEGAAAMLLSSRPDDADLALGYILGGATNNNAFHMTAPSKDADGSRRVMAAALADAALSPEAIDMVCAHATGTSANDSTESAAIGNLLNGRQAPVAAFKSSLGHLLGAAGLAEAIITLECLRHGRIPAVQGLQQQDPACAVDAVRDTPREGEFRTAISNSAGIGGNNSALVISRQPPPDAPAPAPSRGVAVRRWGWVLPDAIGGGESLPALDADALMTRNDALADFSAKPYLSSVKGYLDPASQHTLAAAALALDGRVAHDDPHDRFAIVAATQYGAPGSGYRFYGMMQSKGPRFASPLIFPHSYANTAPNLVAIEFNLGGEHMVLDHAPDAAEAWQWAQHLLRGGRADNVLLLVSEAVTPDLLPDGFRVLNGALAAWLTATDDPADSLPDLAATPTNRHGAIHPTLAIRKA